MEVPQVETFVDLEEADRLAYFEAVYTGFERAARRIGGVIERYYTIGGLTMCLRFAGDSLISQLTPALAHLSAEPTSTPALTICIWDSAATETKLPLLVGSLVDLLRHKWWDLLDIRREIKQYHGQRIRTSFFLGPDILSVLDTQRHVGVYWIEDATRIPYWERGSPFLAILSWWMELRQRHYVHAGAIGTSTGGVLLVGKGGSGKSTTALACLQSDLLYASDDYCLITNEPMPYVYSLYNTAKLKGQQDFHRFPHLRGKISNADRLAEEKAVIFLHQHYPQKVTAGFPIQAVVVPHITRRAETCLQPTSPVHALKALAPSSIFQVPGSGQEKFQTLAQLVKRVPCFRLELGSDVAAIPAIISQFLAQT